MNQPCLNYNELHMLTKNTIEWKYAILKRSFPCLSIGLNCRLEGSLEPPADTPIEVLVLQLEVRRFNTEH
ncbi:UNVERIFIED_CONTAM: hypothetical protein NCL1_31631 [Trichonephila clavipes]